MLNHVRRQVLPRLSSEHIEGNITDFSLTGEPVKQFFVFIRGFKIVRNIGEFFPQPYQNRQLFFEFALVEYCAQSVAFEDFIGDQVECFVTRAAQPLERLVDQLRMHLRRILQPFFITIVFLNNL